MTNSGGIHYFADGTTRPKDSLGLVHLSKVLTGGQTGVDRAAWDAAIQVGIQIGGAVPTRRIGETALTWAEDVEPLPAHYNAAAIPQELVELVDDVDAEVYPEWATDRRLAKSCVARTRYNVQWADATLVLTWHSAASGGTAEAGRFAEELGRPCRVVHLESLEKAVEDVMAFVEDTGVATLNIAGPRQSQSIDKDTYGTALNVLVQAFRRLGFPSLLHRRAEELRPRIAAPSDPVFEGIVAASIEQMYSARAEFVSSAQNAVNFQILAVTGGGALVTAGSVFGDTHPSWIPAAFALALFSAAAIARPFLERKIRAGYDLYSSAVFHAAAIHLALSVPPTHYWIGLAHSSAMCRKYSFQCHGDDDYLDAVKSDHGRVPTNTAEFCAAWRASGANMFKTYETLVFGIGTIAAFAAIAALAVSLLLALSSQ